MQVSQPARAKGVFASIGGILRRPGREPQAVTAAYGARRRIRRDPWAGAAEMRYDDDEPVEDEGFMLPSVEPLRAPNDYGGFQYKPSRRALKREQWRQQQKRRGRPNMSAKPRFRYEQYGDQVQPAPKQYNYSSSGAWRRPKHTQQPFAVSPDPKSIKRANRMIDNEWGRRKYETYAEIAEDDVPVEAEAAPHNRRKEHGSNHNWDSI
jgi:hypothetical protein